MTGPSHILQHASTAGTILSCSAPACIMKEMDMVVQLWCAFNSKPASLISIIQTLWWLICCHKHCS